jgi:hypothetical protein
MLDSNSDNYKRLCIQYRAVFNEILPQSFCKNERLASLAIDYGILGYDSTQSLELAQNHLKTQSFNKLMTDDIILSLHRLTYR